MGVSYKKLWKMLIDRDMSKTQLIQKAGISTNAISRDQHERDGAYGKERRCQGRGSCQNMLCSQLYDERYHGCDP